MVVSSLSLGPRCSRYCEDMRQYLPRELLDRSRNSFGTVEEELPDNSIGTISAIAVPKARALQFLWNKPEISVVLSGMNTKKMIQENCESANNSGINSLTAQELKVIESLTEEFRKKIAVPCTACSYCMPCPQGVNIPQNFACLNNVALERSRFRRIMTRRTYRKLKTKKTKVNSENPNGNATLCIKCGVCATKCPQKIQIPQELEKVKQEMGKRKAILW